MPQMIIDDIITCWGIKESKVEECGINIWITRCSRVEVQHEGFIHSLALRNKSLHVFIGMQPLQYQPLSGIRVEQNRCLKYHGNEGFIGLIST